ncbi:MAG: hypothetical protein HZB29_05520 [Nitrospinae bacterium]|nr:hypothetical protein [Nitrospinota bacterium]
MACGTFSCATSQVDKAFGGSLPADEETKTIAEYCQSCHVHRDFAADRHMEEITGKYGEEPYKSAKSCRTCHTVSRSLMGAETRQTRFPEGRMINE